MRSIWTLHDALLWGTNEMVQLLLEKGGDVNLIYGRYGTALGAAAHAGMTEMVELLLEKGADINIFGGEHGTALGVAAHLGTREMVELLLEKGADINIIGGEYGSVLSEAVHRGTTEMAELLLEKGADINMIGGQCGTALGAAAHWGMREMVELLLEKGADVNIIGGEYGTALGAAAHRQSTEVVELLLDNGADVNIIGGKYGTPLGAAAHWGTTEMVELLLENGADVNIIGGEYGTALGATVVREAYWPWHANQILKLLLARGADVNPVGGMHCHRTPLSVLINWMKDLGVNANCSFDDLLHDRVLPLLEAGADPNVRVEGRSLLEIALDAAVNEKYPRLALELLQRGADITTLSPDYLTAIRVLANRHCGKEMVSLLVRRAGDINRMEGEFGTLMGMALSQKDNKSAKVLFQSGADLDLNIDAHVNRMGIEYGTPLGMAVSQKDAELAKLLLERGADVNLGSGEYGTPLSVAILQKDLELAGLLLERGADVNKGDGKYGNPLEVACTVKDIDVGMVTLLLEKGANMTTTDYGTLLNAATWAGNRVVVSMILGHGRDININTVGGKYGTALGAAVNGDRDLEIVSMLLKRGASVIRVGGLYHTPLGTYPTALDVAAANTTSGRTDDPGLLTLLTDAMAQELQAANLKGSTGGVDRGLPWPPFPMPYDGNCNLERARSASGYAEALQKAEHVEFHAGDVLTPDQARVACQDLDEHVLIRLLVALVGLDGNTHERLQSWIRNDIRYFVWQGFDFGLAYAAVRVAWKDFNDRSQSDVARHRYSWLTCAEHLDEARTVVISRDSAGQELIKSPYVVMPRRVWDLKSNRVVAYRMLHSEVPATHTVGNPAGPTPAPTPRSFWAISHSWTDEMNAVDTSINGYQWSVPLPRNVRLEDVRNPLLDLGAEYVWLDVLCLRQHSSSLSLEQLNIKQDEWKLDVPTIGNVYRAAERIVRYFNGLGIAFTEHGWDSERHWLRRAWTLQEIKTENTTFNGGVVRANVLNTRGKMMGKETTLRRAIRPVLRLAAEVDSPGGCGVYELAREMAKRYSTQPTDKVAGLLYLLRSTELPTYDENITDEVAWRRCLPLLPLERKVELLFDFPYRGLQGEWFPTWKQMMEWPERDPDLDHTRPVLQGNTRCPEIVQTNQAALVNQTTSASFLVCNIWAISNVFFQETGDLNDYEVKVAGKVFGFYPPYLAQDPIDISNRSFTLAVTSLAGSYNWVICEHVGERKEALVDVVVLRKIGVLRTDSCSELLLVGEHTLKQINSVFI